MNISIHKPRKFCWVCLVLLILISSLAPQPVTAASTDRYVATSGDDDDNSCTNAAQPCLTITHAIEVSVSGDTIHIGPGVFVENLEIMSMDLTLIGSGMDVTVIDGNAAGHVIDWSGESYMLTLTDLTLQNGMDPFGVGGGIVSYYGSITATRIRITGNHARSGGGYYGYNSYLTMTDSVVSGNYGDQNGESSGAGGMVFWDCPEASLSRVTVSGNSSLGSVGGIYANATQPYALLLSNVTIANNSAVTDAGMGTNGGTYAITIENSTIVGNQSSGPGSTGGISNAAVTTIRNSILANNGGINCLNFWTWTSQGNNIDSGSTCNFANTGDMQNTDPVLGVLQDNGGYTPTMALLKTSPAINSVLLLECPETDQRGVLRPNGSACDIGAYEFEEPPMYFRKTSPVLGATDRPPSMTLKWRMSNGATQYKYCVRKIGDPCSWKSAGTALSVGISGLLPATNYEWQVKAINGLGTVGANSGVFWGFSTLPVPGNFNKTSPATGTINKPTTLTLYWGVSAKAASYQYCIKKTMTAACTWKTTGTGRMVTLTGLLNNTKYYWQVRAKNAMGTTLANDGTWWNFTTKP